MNRNKTEQTPVLIILPPLPSDYKEENEWVRKNIKNLHGLYTYVYKKTSGWITWGEWLRDICSRYDFWDFAYDTISSNGWCDKETKKPISNISKYISAFIIKEFLGNQKIKIPHK